MTSTNFNKITLNCDVMIHIFKFLNFGDQLRLARVNANLRSIFLQYISPISYNKLKVTKFAENYIVSNDTNTDRILIPNSRDLEEFLQFYGKQVYDYFVKTRRDIQKFEVLFADTPLRMEYFKNLAKLKVAYIDCVTVDDMVQVTNNFPNLEVLEIRANKFETEPQNGCITRAIVKELLRLVKLKELRMIQRCGYKLKLNDFCKIVTKLPLEIIEICCSILLDSDDNKSEFQQSPNIQLMQLERIICTDWIFYSMLNRFQNLKTLTIYRYCNEIASALVSLTQLHQLTISLATFDEDPNVILPPNITTLHLIVCYGLSLDHLQQILHENSNPSLTEFVAKATEFRVKEFRELHISSRIKTLNIEWLKLDRFRSPFVENSALQNLTLNTLPKNHLAMDTLLNLRKLKKLSIRVTLPDEGFYIIRILQELPLLRQLVVEQYVESKDLSLQAVITSVTSLNISRLEESDPTLGFWFDMFSLNPQLELEMQVEIHGTSTLQNLIQHVKFPRNLRKIQICGFTVDCKLRNNFESVLEAINNFVDEDHPTFPRTCNIIMSRNNNKC
ncbi:uncharacterized protein [Musca autumnalis]|uniref:uncharacterized protein n=1 Tax=Musca autumnalis TaxID=221902 RepID=UPI003CEB8506